ncbi:hypothetical protein [Photobacterium kishitanii]|uniref:Uncharacterized protein n=1 Tax=Photobacterium kishitanii TaxID=318456 RepID=A0A2T3KMZ1_9GAMM|nr:hypothetical protein [Photobacterium kishitanii]PSV01161.1 hypothetical protein C9J27_03820 [Photobacterium kishitanii]
MNLDETNFEPEIEDKINDIIIENAYDYDALIEELISLECNENIFNRVVIGEVLESIKKMIKE